MLIEIYEAIEARRLLEMDCGTGPQLAEPYVYGRNLDGDDVIRVYCLSRGRHEGWREWRIAELKNVGVLPYRFRVRSRRTVGPSLQRIYAQVENAPSLLKRWRLNYTFTDAPTDRAPAH